MAKYGEGDSRWIVEDREDGTNVHNWHWSETNCLDWSKNLLTSLLSNKTITTNSQHNINNNTLSNVYITTQKVDKVEGEAYVNVRKGKVIPGYEISFVLSWEGECRDCDGELLKVEGSVEVPYVSDENADEDPEVVVRVKDEGPVGKAFKEAFLKSGKPFVLDQVRAYVTAMANGGPAKEELEVKKPVKKEASQVVDKKEEVKKREEVKKKEKGKEGFKTISLSEKFNCRARDMYEILMDENRWKGFTQSNAKISKDVGGEFSIFDGAVNGVNVELQEGKLIVQKWRFGSWNDGIFSTVRITLEEPEPGYTVVKLTQIDVPEEDRYGNATVVENTERGWRDLIFHKIRAVFGFEI